MERLYYICHNSLCNNKIKLEDIINLDDMEDNESIHSIIQCECCKDEMILSLLSDEDE